MARVPAAVGWLGARFLPVGGRVARLPACLAGLGRPVAWLPTLRGWGTPVAGVPLRGLGRGQAEGARDSRRRDSAQSMSSLEITSGGARRIVEP